MKSRDMEIRLEFLLARESRLAKYTSPARKGTATVGYQYGGYIEVLIDALWRTSAHQDIVEEISRVVVHELIHALGDIHREVHVIILEEMLFDE